MLEKIWCFLIKEKKQKNILKIIYHCNFALALMGGKANLWTKPKQNSIKPVKNQYKDTFIISIRKFI